MPPTASLDGHPVPDLLRCCGVAWMNASEFIIVPENGKAIYNYYIILLWNGCSPQLSNSRSGAPRNRACRNNMEMGACRNNVEMGKAAPLGCPLLSKGKGVRITGCHVFWYACSKFWEPVGAFNSNLRRAPRLKLYTNTCNAHRENFNSSSCLELLRHID